MLLGLPCTGETIQLSKHHKPLENFVIRNFPVKSSLTRTTVEAALHRRIRGDTIDDVEDVVRLICIYFCYHSCLQTLATA